jgi:hypothetical protein
MPTTRASRLSAALPTMLRTALAASLSERRIIGSSSARSSSRSARRRTSWRRR